jgi:FAD-dependent oxidoreductase domain-containing protein 1
LETDVLVVGAGVLGLSSAYYLKKRDPSRKVVVVEKLSGPGQGNSAKSEGGYRNLFASETNYLLAASTIDWFHHLKEDMEYDVGLHELGYLWLLPEDEYRERRAPFDVAKRRGARILEYSSEELKAMIPDLVTEFDDSEESQMMALEDVEMGVFGPKCGSVDVDRLVKAYEAEFLKIGGEIHYNTEATKLLHDPVEPLGIPGEPFVWQESRIAGADTSKGRILAETTVVACGVWAGKVLDPIGFDCLMRPKKRQIFAFKDPKLGRLLNTKDFNDDNKLPVTILPTAGILLKGEVSEESIWLACADNLGRKFELEDDPQPEDDYYSNNIYHALVQYLPCFEDVRPANSWAGQYAINGFDQTPVVEAGSGIIYVGAASGSGIMKSDALGRIVDAVNEDKEYATLYGGRGFKCSDLSVAKRRVERETLVV